MAKCKALTGSAVKGLFVYIVYICDFGSIIVFCIVQSSQLD